MLAALNGAVSISTAHPCATSTLFRFVPRHSALAIAQTNPHPYCLERQRSESHQSPMPNYPMHITCHAQRQFPGTAAQAFALCIDSARFPQWFRGYGPIAAITRVEADGVPRVGGQRTVYNADRSMLHECITALDPPHHHAYTLSGFRPPFSWLVRQGAATWEFADSERGTRVRWRYTFTVTSALAWPLAKPVLAICMAGAMRRCLDNMARALSPEDA